MSEDTISRQQAIDEIARWIGYLDDDMIGRIQLGLKRLPSAQPERLTDDDFETIRIHLNAFKEKLCNQQRWEEANEYQRIIDRFMAFASAQPVAKDINVPIKDYISRKAAIEALFELYEYQRDIDPTEAADLVRQGVYLAEKKIEQLPSAQPEIVKCKDCKYWTHIKRTNRYWCKTDDGLFDLNPSSDDFCSRAERRTDEVQRL